MILFKVFTCLATLYFLEATYQKPAFSDDPVDFEDKSNDYYDSQNYTYLDNELGAYNRKAPGGVLENVKTGTKTPPAKGKTPKKPKNPKNPKHKNPKKQPKDNAKKPRPTAVPRLFPPTPANYDAQSRNQNKPSTKNNEQPRKATSKEMRIVEDAFKKPSSNLNIKVITERRKWVNGKWVLVNEDAKTIGSLPKTKDIKLAKNLGPGNRVRANENGRKTQRRSN